MSFENYACWKALDAERILRIEALEGSRAVFMAVHSPIRDFVVEGSLAGSLGQCDEDELLAALCGPDHRHLFCVVEGEPGSGKSHLIRWLQFRWRQQRPEDFVLMVPRSNGSLQGALRHMRERLEGYTHLFAGLGQVQDTTLRGRARDFHSRLANSLSPDYFVGQSPVHGEWVEKYQLSRLLGHHQLLEQWRAPHRILATLSGGSDRNSRVESFSVQDIHELALLLRSVRDRSVGSKALQARRKFERESNLLDTLLRDVGEQSVDEDHAAEVAPMLMRLREALNARFNAVVQDLVGIGRDGLVRAFRELRRQLAQDGRRLVLLLEDITSFQGVDNQLLDVLIAKSETEEQDGLLCDLLSVVGITPDYFNRSMRGYGNLRERISLHLNLDDVRHETATQSRSLAQASNREQFVSRYMRAIRAGIETIEQWDEGGFQQLANACSGCRHRDPCHRAFGANADGVGYYPLSPRAIERIFGALKDPKGTMSLRTPRGIVQNLLAPLLLHPEHLTQGQYPPANLEGANLPKDERYLIGEIESVPARFDDPSERERMRRFIVWWSSPSPKVRTERDAQGRLCFAGIPREAYLAFGFPWLGVEVKDEGEVEAPSVPLPTDERPEPEAVQTPAGGEAETHTSPPVRAKPKTRTESSSSSKPKVGRTQLDKLRTELKGWFEGEAVRDSKGWSRLMMGILETLPWRSLGVSAWLQRQLFTEATVVLEGARRADVRHLVIPRVSWVREGLDGWLALRTKDTDEVEYNRKRVARFLRRLHRLVTEHVDGKLLTTSAGEAWNPAGTAAQILVARAWLQARLRGASLAERWEMILGEDEGTALSTTAHTQGWQEIVRQVSNYLRTFREFLRFSIQLGSTPDKGIVDAGAIAGALVAFVQQNKPDLPPPETELTELPKQLAEWQSIAKAGRSVRKIMPQLSRHELNRIEQNIETIERACDRRTIPQYLDDVAQVIEKLRTTDNLTPQFIIEKWAHADQALAAKGLSNSSEGDKLRKLDEFVGETDPEVRARVGAASAFEQLEWIIEAPCDDLLTTAEQLGAVEQAIEQLWNYTSKQLAESSNEASDAPERLTALSERVVTAAEGALRALSGEGKTA